MRLAIRLALLTIVGIGCLAWVAVSVGQLGGPGGMFASTYPITMDLRDATGLLPGDAVRLAGVAIGRVDDVRVHEGKARVTLAIDEAYAIPEQASLRLRWRSVLGQRFVDVVPPDDAVPDGPRLAAGDHVPIERTGETADLSELLNEVEPVLGSLDTEALNRVTATLAGVLEGREREMGEAIEASSLLLDQLAGRADRIGDMVSGFAEVMDGLAERDDEIVAVLDSLAEVAEDIGGQRADLGRAIAEAGRFSDTFATVLEANREDLPVVVDQLGQVAGTLAAEEHALSEGLRTLVWTSAGLIRATNHGDWIQVYGRGFGVINTFTPEPRVGPDYGDAGPDDTDAPEPLLGQPHLPAPDVPTLQVGPLTLNPGGDDPEGSSGLELLLQPLRGER